MSDTDRTLPADVFVSVLLAGGVLSACGGTTSLATSSTASDAAASAICKAKHQVDRLIVQRSDAFPQNGFTFRFPTVVMARNLVLVRAVATALCSLPRAPDGVRNCAADFGIQYGLTFYVDNRVLPTISIDPGGCEGVRGAGLDGYVAYGIWEPLGKAIGIPTANILSFEGPITE